MSIKKTIKKLRRGGQDGEHMYTHGWFMSVYGKKSLQYCEVISLQLK